MKPLKGDSNCDPYPCRTLWGAPGVKTKNPSPEEEGAWMQATIEVSREGSGEVFFLDILSHRMSAIVILCQLSNNKDNLQPSGFLVKERPDAV